MKDHELARTLSGRGPFTGFTGQGRVFVTLEMEPECDFAPEEHFGDADDVAWVRRQLNEGNEWAWCQVRVHVQCDGYRGSSDWLGGCSYESEADFCQASGYYGDMLAEAIADMREQAAAEQRLQEV